MIQDHFPLTEIRRHGDIAEVVVDFYEGDPLKPVRLIGFSTDADLSDFEILEEADDYYDRLKYELYRDS